MRASTGGTFASTLSAQEIQGTREHMLGSNGQAHDAWVPLTIEEGTDHLLVTGSLAASSR